MLESCRVLESQAAKKDYKPEGVLAAMVFSVLLLNFFMIGCLAPHDLAH